MTTITPAFAFIGRSFSSEAYELLYKASLSSREQRRALRSIQEPPVSRRWRGSGERITVPLRLPG